MHVKLTALTKVDGQWRQPGETVKLPDTEARRLIRMKAAEAAGAEQLAKPTGKDEIEAMRAEITRLQEFERRQLAAEADANAIAEKEEAERKTAEAAAAKGKGKAGTKDDADGQTDGK
ncbi:hypothetical protein ACX1C1_21480 [Paenibacillus sp. strain BS8-2]